MKISEIKYNLIPNKGDVVLMHPPYPKPSSQKGIKMSKEEREKKRKGDDKVDKITTPYVIVDISPELLIDNPAKGYEATDFKKGDYVFLDGRMLSEYGIQVYTHNDAIHLCPIMIPIQALKGKLADKSEWEKKYQDDIDTWDEVKVDNSELGGLNITEEGVSSN